MKNYLKHKYMLGLSLLALATACEDQTTEITSIDYDRLFAPIKLEARVKDRTNVELSWNLTKGASSYNIELFANDSLTFVGSPVLTFSGITEEEIPYTIKGLEGETQYSARIQSVNETESETSKWSGVFFETDTEQILSAVTEEDLTFNSVVLRWTPGEEATEIRLEPADVEPHIVTAEEIAVGIATITGLKAETEYTAKLMKGEKTRGTQTFKTLIDLGGAIEVKPESDFISMLENANDGDAFALHPGTYTIPGEEDKVGSLKINKNIEIKAVRPSDRPIINGCIQLLEGASLSMSQIILDGTNTDGSQTFDFKTATEYGKFFLDDCEIRNYTKGFYYVNVAANISEITINNCLIHNIECNGGDLFDSRKGYIAKLNITNSTIWNSCKARDFIRYDDASGSFAGAAPIITIDHCTIDGVSNDASRRLLYVRFKNNTISITNNIISNMPACGRGFSDQSNTAVPTFENNNYFNTINLTSKSGESTAKFFDERGTTLDPNYKDTTNGDFTLGNEDLIYNKVGDPRWY
ncbi:fibronectin type III domain-containing protein [Bacteroides caecigallinarum]|nr:fibronectin type III domain-containing protein [Bacteroides caecigallinarum]